MMKSVELQDVAEILMGTAPPGSSYNTDGIGIPLVAGAGDYGATNPLPKKWTTSPTRLAEPGDLILCVRATIGDLNWADKTYCLGRGVAAVRPKNGKLDRNYLAQFIGANKEQLSRLGTGSTFLAIRRGDIETFPIPLPPLEEQKRIAAILDKADVARRKRQDTVDEITAITDAVFFEMFGDVSINDRGWQTVAVDEAGEVQLGRQRAPRYQTGKYTRPYMRVANVYEDRIDLSDVLSMDFDPSDFRKYQLEDGDILLNEGQSTELVGRPAIWRGEIANCCFQNTLVRFRTYPQKTDAEYALSVFLRYLHSSKFAMVSTKTSSVAHLGAARFSKMPFPLPPLGLQKEFARLRASQRRSLRNAIDHASELDDLFNSLVQRAFRGEL